MPSDPSGRHPTGVLTRIAPDFFDDAVAFGGYAAVVGIAGQDFYIKVSLYNDAAIGYKLKVYGFSIANDSGGGSQAFMTAGVPTGALVARCNPLDASQPAPYGLIYQDTQHVPAGNPIPFTIPGAPALLGAEGFDSATVPSPFPFFIVPAGYALSVINYNPGNRLGASFWYQEAIE